MESNFDSKAEEYFSWWVQELFDNGFIKEFKFQPEPFKLSDQTMIEYYEPYKKKEGGKWIPEEIISGHIYTTDAYIEWENKAVNFLAILLEAPCRKKKNRSFTHLLFQHDQENNTRYSFIEIKPAFDANNMTRLAKINIKWVWQKYGFFVNIVTVEKLFDKTFTPEKYLTTDKTDKPRKIKYKNIITLKQFIKNHKECMNF